MSELGPQRLGFISNGFWTILELSGSFGVGMSLLQGFLYRCEATEAKMRTHLQGMAGGLEVSKCKVFVYMGVHSCNGICIET